jgi:hypothetical protein
MNRLRRTDCVAVVDGTLKEPGYGLKTGVRMRGYLHAFDLRRRAKMVEKNPCPNPVELGVWNVAAHLNFGAGREFDEARFDYLHHRLPAFTEPVRQV